MSATWIVAAAAARHNDDDDGNDDYDYDECNADDDDDDDDDDERWWWWEEWGQVKVAAGSADNNIVFNLQRKKFKLNQLWKAHIPDSFRSSCVCNSCLSCYLY